LRPWGSTYQTGCAGGEGGENGGGNDGESGDGGDRCDGGEGNGNGGIGGGDFALVMPNEANAMRRKMMRACRGAAPKRPTEPG
jgi:hypothetical protein